jgi:hypothetical protein
MIAQGGADGNAGAGGAFGIFCQVGVPSASGLR